MKQRPLLFTLSQYIFKTLSTRSNTLEIQYIHLALHRHVAQHFKSKWQDQNRFFPAHKKSLK